MMLKVILYGYCVGIRSSRRIEKKTYEDVAFRVLSCDTHQDHSRISDFRKRHLKEISRLFVQVLDICKESGLVKLGHVALDGAKVKANASRHKAISYARMKKREPALAAEVDRLLAEAQALNEQARKEAREAGKLDKDAKPPPGGEEGSSKTPAGIPEDKEQRNFTDPESRIMLNGATKAFVQGYNGQATVDCESQVIVAANVTQQPNDKQQLVPMVEQIEDNLGEIPDRGLADAGSFVEEKVESLADNFIEPFIPRDRIKHSDPPQPAPRGRIPNGTSVVERMLRKLKTKAVKKTYLKRKETVEPVFGQIKEARGIRAFLLRGLAKVKAE
jgi:hypothetical protein